MEQGPSCHGDMHAPSGDRRWSSVLRGTGQGVLPYLNEPVSASSVASCPGTAFRRAHTHRSSFHCAASCRGKENRSCCCAGWTEGRPTPIWVLCTIPLAGEGRWRAWELEMGTDGNMSWALDCLEDPFFLRTPNEVHLFLVFSRSEKNRAPPNASLLGTHTKKQKTTKTKIRSNFRGRKEEAPGPSERHNAPSQTSKNHTQRTLGLCLAQSQQDPRVLWLCTHLAPPGDHWAQEGCTCTFTLISSAPTLVVTNSH